MDKSKARELLRHSGLRATSPRLAVVQVLAGHSGPLSHSQVLRRLGDTDWDPATIYRNLVKLTEAGVATVVSNAGGMARYALAHGTHCHPHFVCTDCGQVSGLPQAIPAPVSVPGRWGPSLRTASVQLQGHCPDCLAGK